jgi:cytochrome oxidase Cu insertion factor (SCO1/SenC/PrrC family)
MNQARAWLAAIMLLPLLGVACSQGGTDADANGGLVVEKPAPDFTLPSANGSKVSLSDYKGRPVLLYFSMGPG